MNNELTFDDALFDGACDELGVIDEKREKLLVTLRSMIDERAKAFVERQKVHKRMLNAPIRPEWLLEEIDYDRSRCSVLTINEKGQLLTVTYDIDTHGMGGATEYHVIGVTAAQLDTLAKCKKVYDLLRSP